MNDFKSIKDLSRLLCNMLESYESGIDCLGADEKISEIRALRDENERLKKELKEYKILVDCSDLDNFNPALFQKKSTQNSKDEFDKIVAEIQ